AGVLVPPRPPGYLARRGRGRPVGPSAGYHRLMRFAKGHGTENDFVILLDPDGREELTRALAARLCDRRAGPRAGGGAGGGGALRLARLGAALPGAALPGAARLWTARPGIARAGTARPGTVPPGPGCRVLVRSQALSGSWTTGTPTAAWPRCAATGSGC